MSFTDLTFTVERWAELHAEGYRASTIKGNPWRVHARKAGENTALCGKKPGTSGGTKQMKDRTGWLYYTNDQRPNCVDCARVDAETPELGSEAHLDRALRTGE